MTTKVIYTPEFLKHISYPEQPDRVAFTMEYFKSQGLPEFTTPEPIGAPYIKTVHKPSHYKSISRNPETLHNSMIAVDGCITAAKMLVNKETDNAFVLCRPPGHHAHPNQYGGFCYFNNAAITARYLQSNGFQNIMIIDWDAHHGDGTNHIFHADPTVLYASIHESPGYPGTGNYTDNGEAKGTGYSVNLPVPHDTGHSTYMELFDEIIVPIGKKFKPDAIIISAGQDSHVDDPITSLGLVQQSFYDMTHKVMSISPNIIAVLEGGYNLTNVPKANYAIVSALNGTPATDLRFHPLACEPTRTGLVSLEKESVMKHW